ncbi:hypothetical protein Prudu_000074 [Prunus dulcis]|uniref:SUEL-type lectin domain-containing protein n=1 Tax=Prunus dulcis TaxID=3755 RepID=A0A4Y1QKC8_PRUDU|nr:hypothetical protein Prudu_000074 [Prunus dulcis]
MGKAGQRFPTCFRCIRSSTDIKCPNKKKVVAVEFASFGDPPAGYCGSYVLGKCNSPVSKEVVEQHCLGKSSCSVPINRNLFLKNITDGCQISRKHLLSKSSVPYNKKTLEIYKVVLVIVITLN